MFFQSSQADTDSNMALQPCLGQATVTPGGYSLSYLKGESQVCSKSSPTCPYKWFPGLHEVALSPQFQIYLVVHAGISPLEIRFQIQFLFEIDI